MRVHWFQHVPFEGLGSIAAWMQANGHDLSTTRLYAGEAPPPVDDYDWLIVMGGPMNIHEEQAYPWLRAEKIAIRAAIAQGRRVLGICLGAQLIADVLGARVGRNHAPEIGWFPVELTAQARDCTLLAEFPAKFEAYHWHGDYFEIPTGAVHLARSAACAQQAFSYGNRVIALQFHLECTADGAAALIAAAGQGIMPAPYVQPAAAMLADPARFTRLNALMAALLARLGVA
jgi:GMP synthase-like glutamine amidotransferase